MRKISLLAAMLVMLNTAPSFSQGVDYSDVNIFGAGISLGWYGHGFYGSRSISIPPLSAYYEMGVHEYITAGPFVGFNRWSYRYSNSRYSWTYIHAGLRGSFHYSGILNEMLDGDIDESKLDLYVTLMSGLQLQTYTTNEPFLEGLYDNRVRFFLGPVAGLRYNFSESFGVFAEGGYGSLGALTLGISMKL